MAAALINFVFFVVSGLLWFAVWIIVAGAIVSWLVAFDVINMRNTTARQLVHFLDAITRPLLRPLRRLIPTLGGIDITPVILIILLQAVNSELLPPLRAWLLSLAGAPVY